MLIRGWRHLSPREKSIALIVFAVLLPTLLLFYGQYRALNELRDKSKVSYANDLRINFLKIEDETQARLLETARLTLQDFPDSAGQPWDEKLIEKNLSAILDKNAGVESSFLYTAFEDKFSVALYRPEKGFLQAVKTNSPGDFFSRFYTDEENFVLPVNDVAYSSRGQDTSQKFFIVQRRCQTCQSNGQPPNEVLYLFRMLSDTKDLTNLRVVGVRLKQNYLIEKFLSPVIAETVSDGSTNLGLDLTFAVFNERKQLLYSKDGSGTFDDFEVKNSFNSVLPMWTVAGRYGNRKIEDLSNLYFWRGLIIMSLIFGFLLFGAYLLLGVTKREVDLADAKSAFVSNVSHELKTPLALIRLFAETLQSGRIKKPEKIQEYYRIITTETVRLTNLINNILDFSAIEAGRKEYNFEPCDLAETVAEVVQNYSYSLENAGFTVKTNFQKDLPLVAIDCDAISQAVLNLLNNAVKYSADEKFVEINVERQSENIAVEITDHGIGIAPNEQEKIFGNFYRVGGSNDVHNVKGSGLGLALVTHIVEAHGGKVSVNSVVNRGSTFTILIPIESDNSEGKKL